MSVENSGQLMLEFFGTFSFWLLMTDWYLWRIVGGMSELSSLLQKKLAGRALPRRRAQVETRTIDLDRDAELVRLLSEKLGILSTTAQVLIARGIRTLEDAQTFLSPSLRDHLPDPGQVKNITAAAERILEAVRLGQQITVYSDFDVDGLTAGAQLDLYVSALGGVVNRYTPNRFTEGYGLIKSAVEKLGRANTQLLVTVDCGISSVQEIALAKRLGMDVIVLDHHHAHDLPPADVIVNPTQPGCSFRDHQLCAAGLVWMLLIVLRRSARETFAERIASGETELPDPKDFLDLAALGTICDMVPLVGLNRLIAIRGMDVLRSTRRVGLEALKQIAGLHNPKRLNAGHVSFAIGPRINAAGRLEDAGEVFELLTTTNTTRAQKLSEQINRLNVERKQIEDDVLEVCLEQIREQPELLQENAFALFGDAFHAGVIGIVAQRLVEQFHRPAAVMAPGELQLQGKTIPVIKGSIRSVPGFHVAEVLASMNGCLLKAGGHAQAGGFTLEVAKLAEFQQQFCERAKALLSAEALLLKRHADIELKIRDVDFRLVDELERLAPFGIGNPAPLLVSRGIKIVSVQALGDKHLRLRLSDDSGIVGAVAWRMFGHPLLVRDRIVNIAYGAEINSYQGLSSVQLNIKEVWEG